MNLKAVKGRGTHLNPPNRFEVQQYQPDPEYQEHLLREGELASNKPKTLFTEVYPKSILNKVTSPDIGKNWSMNPYQGCEHGCVYCYARNSHEYWGYNAGLDFETKIMVKKNAPALLEQALQQPRWQPEPIMLSGNTDCYQPAEKIYQITRKLLQVCLKYRQPVGVITKNALIQRDVDLLQKLAEQQLVRVCFSVTTLDEKLRRCLEPRTATATKKLQTIRLLAENNIPVQVMMAPIIPGLNSEEIFQVAEATAQAGARQLSYTTLRLNGALAPLFLNWLGQHYPERKLKIKHQIEELHGGKMNDSQFGRRMRGSGVWAENLKQSFALARSKFFKDAPALPDYRTDSFLRLPRGQYSLF